jgi:hypothetical protein
MLSSLSEQDMLMLWLYHLFHCSEVLKSAVADRMCKFTTCVKILVNGAARMHTQTANLIRNTCILFLASRDLGV